MSDGMFKFFKELGLPTAIICVLLWFANGVYVDLRNDSVNREAEYQKREDTWHERMKSFEDVLDKITGTLETIDGRLEKLED